MKVLGVDPGLVRTGWAAVESLGGEYRLLGSGLIAPSADGALTERLAEGYEQFSSVLAELEPDVMVLEDIFSAPRHPSAALKMAHMRGVLCLAAGQRGLHVEHMTATTVKQRVTGNGHASKEQLQEMVFRLCGIEPREMRADVSDAIALAVAGLNQLERGVGVRSRESGVGGRRREGVGAVTRRRGEHTPPDSRLLTPGPRGAAP
jgi:crossover junction endodeoxyribonuclease RuvC